LLAFVNKPVLVSFLLAGKREASPRRGGSGWRGFYTVSLRDGGASPIS
jgi:hypothetical protein